MRQRPRKLACFDLFLMYVLMCFCVIKQLSGGYLQPCKCLCDYPVYWTRSNNRGDPCEQSCHMCKSVITKCKFSFKCRNYNDEVDGNISQWCVLLILFKYNGPSSHIRDIQTQLRTIITSYLWKYHFHMGVGKSKVPLAVRRDGHGVFRTILWTSITGWHWGEQCCTPHQSLTSPPPHPSPHPPRPSHRTCSCTIKVRELQSDDSNGRRWECKWWEKECGSARAQNFDVWNVTAPQIAVKKGPPEYFITHNKSICTGEAETSLKVDSVRLKFVCVMFTRSETILIIQIPVSTTGTVSRRLIIWLQVWLHPSTSGTIPSVLAEFLWGCAQFY